MSTVSENTRRIVEKTLLLVIVLLTTTQAPAGLFDSKLVRAARNGDVSAIKAEIDRGADVNRPGAGGATPLLVASQAGRTEVVDFLLRHGANPNHSTDGGSSALGFAAWKGHLEIVKLLIANGAVVDVRGPGGMTPLATAAEFDHPAVVAALLDAGANPHIRNQAGKSAVSIFETSERRDESLLQRMRQVEMPVSDAPAMSGEVRGAKGGPAVVCEEKLDSGVTTEQAKTLRYLLRNKLVVAMKIPVSQADRRICIESITATDKIPLRGNTVVKYMAVVMFPMGHMTHCLGEGSAEAASRRLQQPGFDFDAFLQASGECGRFSQQHQVIKPQPPGARLQFAEEDEI